MQVVYTKNGEEQKIWDKEETLLKEISKSEATDDLKISEQLKLDLKDKNELLNDFKQQLGITIDAKYTIMLKIKILTDIEEQEIVDEYTPVINVDLAEKTTKISGENNTERTEYISKEYKITQGQSIIIKIFDIIVIIIAVLLLKYALTAKTMNKVRNEYKNKTIFPPYENIFDALRFTDYDDVKVVILGQDPYHEEGQANGLAFSVSSGVDIPPSLKNIFKK